MKKLVSLILIAVLCLTVFAGCGNKTDFTVGVCQLMEHESLDKATNGFKDALTAELQKAGKTVTIDVQVAGESDVCTTIINAFTAKKVDLIMANATPALAAAATATKQIPILGTSVTDYADTFAGSIAANVSGTSDAVPFDEQAQMMITTLNLVAGDQVGVIYCTGESNSLIQYNAVKALFEAEGIVVEAYSFSETTELPNARPSTFPPITRSLITTPWWAPSAVPQRSPFTPVTAAPSATPAWPSTTTSWAMRPARWPLRSCWAPSASATSRS